MSKTKNPHPEWFDACSLHSQYNARLLSEWHGGRTLLKAALRRLNTKLWQPRPEFEPVVTFHGLLIFDREDLHGGGVWWAQEFARALIHFGIGKCQRIFDFCAGPGYIGYFLLASGYCETLAMADIDPEAMAAARFTARYNGIENLVALYTSDVLEQIPATEKWDLVVQYPPFLKPEGPQTKTVLEYDQTGTLPARFYTSVKKFMRPGGLVLSLLGTGDSTPEYFRPMIEAGGGKIKDTLVCKDLHGNETDRYFLLSEW